MILFELYQTEQHANYQTLEISNGARQYDFLNTIVAIAIDANKVFLSQHIIKAFNFHAITCLHTNPGEYRPCDVRVGPHQPPAPFRVPALMDDFVNTVNRVWDSADPVALCTYVLWRLNNIHPFINGNGRTARAASYFVLCLKSGGLLGGQTILPELIKRERAEYCDALQEGHDSLGHDLSRLHRLVSRLIGEQLASVPDADTTEASDSSESRSHDPSNDDLVGSTHTVATGA